MTSHKEEKSLWGVAVRGEGGIAGERRVVGVFFLLEWIRFHHLDSTKR